MKIKNNPKLTRQIVSNQKNKEKLSFFIVFFALLKTRQDLWYVLENEEKILKLRTLANGWTHATKSG